MSVADVMSRDADSADEVVAIMLLSGLLGLVAVAMMVTLVVLAVRRDRALRRNAPEAVAPRHGGLQSRQDGGSASPPAHVP